MARHSEIYKAKEWKKSRDECKRRANGLCERHKRKGKYVKGNNAHHKTCLTDENKHDWNIAYNVDNLEWLCDDCHNDEHDRSNGLQKFLKPLE